MKHAFKYIIWVIIAILATSANATLMVNIDKGNLKPAPFVISYFAKNDFKTYDIDSIIIRDLTRSGYFKFIGHTTDNIDTAPNFSEYRNINAVLLITGTIKKTGHNTIDIYVRAWDVVVGKQIFGKVFSTKTSNWRRIGHLISDEIYKRITGNGGYFDSKMAYVSETGDFFHRKKRIALMDQDGENHIYLTNGSNPVLTPVLSPGGESIMYVTYVNKTPKVMLFNTKGRATYMVGNFPGTTYAPRFSPADGDVVALAASIDGTTNIFKVNLKQKATKQLTNNKSINTSPSFSPDGKKIAFVSDRTGSQQIYVMNSDGSNQRRISMGYGQYSTPSWSPTGEYIAFTKIEERKFYIGIMRPNGNDERLLAQGYMIEGPSWAPNGKVIAFTKEIPGQKSFKKSNIYLINTNGKYERLLKTPEDASDVSWGGYGVGYSK